MKILRNALCLMFGLGSMAGVSLGNCWMECVVPNPISGGCGKEVKVCDIGDPGQAAASLGNDIKDAENRIVAIWHNAWGDVPVPLRTVLEEYPITIACVIFPQTRGYALVVGALEGMVAHAKDRTDQAQPIMATAPDWKKQDIALALRYVTMLEGGDVSVTDWNAPNAAPFRDRYALPYSEFLTCISAAQDITAGSNCYRAFQENAVKERK